jgi:hypothetical protein
VSERINELQMNTKNKDIRDMYGAINEFKKGYQYSNLANFILDENAFPQCLEWVEE